MAAQALLRILLAPVCGLPHKRSGPTPRQREELGPGSVFPWQSFQEFTASKSFGAHQWHKVNEETCFEHEERLQAFCKCDLENSYLIDANI